MTVNEEFLLTWLPCFDLRRKELVELLNSLGIVTASVRIALVVEPFSAVKSAFFQLFYEQSSRKYISLEADVVLLAALISSCDIVIRVAEVDNGIISHIKSKFKGMLKQGFSVTFSLIAWKYA